MNEARLKTRGDALRMIGRTQTRTYNAALNAAVEELTAGVRRRGDVSKAVELTGISRSAIYAELKKREKR